MENKEQQPIKQEQPLENFPKSSESFGEYGNRILKNQAAEPILQDDVIEMPNVEELCEQYLPNQFELKSFRKKEVLFLQTAFEQGARVMFNTIKNNKSDRITSLETANARLHKENEELKNVNREK